MEASTTSPGRLRRVARWTALRLRIDETLRRTFFLLPFPLLYAVAALTIIKVFRLQPATQATLLWVGILPVGALLVGVAHAWLRRRPSHIGALALDRFHGLHDRITTALSFRELPESERTPFMDAAILDALNVAVDLKPRRAAPFHWPRELPLVLFLLAGVIAVGLFEVRTTRYLPSEARIQPLVMSPDDIELFREMAQQLEQKNEDPEALAAARRFNQLVEDISQRRLERREVFERLEQLERDLLESAEAEKEALQQGLESMARELERSDLSKPVAQAFEEKRLADAEKAMRELAERLKRKKNPPSKAQLQRLREALEKASQKSTERAKRLAEQRKQLAEQKKSLLKKKNSQDGGLSKQDQSQLDRLERKLERLEREQNQADRARRQLSQLDRELAKAAADLLKEAGLSADDLESAAADINRMAQEELSRKEKEDLRRRLQELRELIRQQGKGGRERLKQLMRFGERARGQGQRGQGQKGQGQKGQGQKGQGQPGGTGQPGADGDPRLVLGPGGAPIPIPGGGQPGSQPGQGSEGGDGAGRGGLEAGHGHDPNLQGDKSELKGSTHDVTAAGVDTGEGTASSEVIYSAAQRGFVGRGYRRVYTDYRTVAEQVMTQDEIPPGYRFYVQRYFQLIRPRE